MTEHYELDVVLAKAEAACRNATRAFRTAQADLARANADWGKFVADRRKPGAIRRKSGAAREQTRPDRRQANADFVALSKAVADRQNAYADLCEAEARWVKAEAMLAKAEAEFARAQSKRDMAEGKSKELAGAPDRFSALDFQIVEGGRFDIPLSRLAEASKRGSANVPCSTKPDQHCVRDEETRSRDASGRRKSIQRFNGELPPRAPNRVMVFIRSPLLRQSIGLLGLTLAYLQYWYFDIQVQIAGMPSIVAPLLQ